LCFFHFFCSFYRGSSSPLLSTVTSSPTTLVSGDSDNGDSGDSG
jgi:hypothetical protein